MSATLILALALLLLLAVGVPVAFALGLASALALLSQVPPDAALATAAQRAATGLDSFSLLAIPFFVLSGELMNRGGVARRLVRLGSASLGMLPGGLLIVDVVACMLFGALSGSAVAATAAIGGFLIPRMEDEGYPRDASTALTVAGSTTGLLIPPSNILIVYALASGGVSVAALFVAGYLPGLVVGVLLLIAALFGSRNRLPKASSWSTAEFGRAFVDALPSLLLIVVVMGGIVTGQFTATEAAAIAVLYSLGLALAYREVGVADLPAVLRDAAATSGVVLLLIATSMSMAWVLAFESVPQRVATLLLEGVGSSGGWSTLLLINLVLLLAGTFLDMTPAVLLFTPIFLPVAMELGVHPVHFGVVMVLNLCIGLCTPPVGTALFVGLGVGRVPLGHLVRRLMPLYVAMVVALLVISLFPELSLWLPRRFGLL